MKKINKILSVSFLLLISSCLIVSGAVFSILWGGTITANADVLLEYDSGGGFVNAEDLTVDITTSTIVAGETETITHAWQTSSNWDIPDYDIQLDLTYTGGSADLVGIDLYVYIDDGTTNTTVLQIVDGVATTDNNYVVEGSDSGTVFIELVADDHLEEGAYDWDISLDVSAINTNPNP